MKINVVGLGYIGLPTALTMANAGFTVVGTDYNKGLVETLNAGKVTFEEKDWLNYLIQQFLQEIFHLVMITKKQKYISFQYQRHMINFLKNRCKLCYKRSKRSIECLQR